MREQNGKKEVDDQTVVADMNVEGMPWYDSQTAKLSDAQHTGQGGKPSYPYTRRETLGLMLRGMGVCLLAAVIIAAVMFLVILFFVKIW